MSMAGAKGKAPAPQLPLSPSYPTEAADENENTIPFTFHYAVGEPTRVRTGHSPSAKGYLPDTG